MTIGLRYCKAFEPRQDARHGLLCSNGGLEISLRLAVDKGLLGLNTHGNCITLFWEETVFASI